MKKSLEWLKARSRRIVLNMEAVDIAKKAKSPTDAFNMAKQGSFHIRENGAAETVRYLAMIKRDYGKKELDNFVDGCWSKDFAESFLDQVSIAATYVSILEASFILGEGNNSIPDKRLAMHFAKMISAIVSDFEKHYLLQLSENMHQQRVCLDIFKRYRFGVEHFCVMAGKIENVLCLDRDCFEKVSRVLLNIGFAVSEFSGVHFLGMTPVCYIERYKQNNP